MYHFLFRASCVLWICTHFINYILSLYTQLHYQYNIHSFLPCLVLKYCFVKKLTWLLFHLFSLKEEEGKVVVINSLNYSSTRRSNIRGSSYKEMKYNTAICISMYLSVCMYILITLYIWQSFFLACNVFALFLIHFPHNLRRLRRHTHIYHWTTRWRIHFPRK